MTEKKRDSIGIVERKNSRPGLGVAECENIERRLADSERKYRLVFEAAASAVVLVDGDGNIQDSNFRLEELTGYSISHIKGRDVRIFVHPDHFDRACRDLEGIFTKGPIYNQEYKIIHQDGRVIDVSVNASAPHDGDQRERLAVIVISDITEQKQNAMRAQMLSRVVDQSPNEVIITDTEGLVEYVNSECLETVGYTFNEVLGKNVDILNKQPEDMCQNMLAKLRSGQSWRGEFIKYKKNGDGYWVNASVSPIKNADGVITHFLAINRDITERKQAEESLRQARNFSQSIIDTAQAIILILDTEGKIVSFNPYMVKLCGYTLEEVMGKDWFETFLPESDKPHIREVFKKAIGTVQAVGNVNPIVTKDGREVEIEWYSKTLRNSNGEIIGILSIGLDVSNRKKAERKLAENQR
ncbi:MAG: PAS domain-containing protein, partial [Phycisphaerae bacterium]|nr:PAS domain-containing protein [Phycisphaerae bacterium]